MVLESGIVEKGEIAVGTVELKDVLFKRTGRLFAKPSFLTGLSVILDIGATFNQYSEDKTELEADMKALRSDWYSVGDDIAFALELYRAGQFSDNQVIRS